MVLHKLGFVMDQYVRKSELPNSLKLKSPNFSSICEMFMECKRSPLIVICKLVFVMDQYVRKLEFHNKFF
jgi:hypothetical protein